MKSRLPQTEASLQTAFAHCKKQGSFKLVDPLTFVDYLERAERDLVSAERDLEAGDLHWARVKSYQALFHLFSALLVKHLGYFSKDHGCILVALLNEGIISLEIASKLHLLVNKTVQNTTAKKIYEDIDEFRIQRNFSLYKPKAWEDVKHADVAEEIHKIKENFKILVSLL